MVQVLKICKMEKILDIELKMMLCSDVDEHDVTIF